MSVDLAPIAVFAYNRPDRLRHLLDSLLANDLAGSSSLHIYCDGPKSEEDEPLVQAVRECAEGTSGFASVRVVARKENAGLADSIIAGVTEICDGTESVIVVEDDLILSRYFLRFLNDGLVTYRDEPGAASVSGFARSHHPRFPETYFLRTTSSLGWGTWRRSWEHFESDGAALLRVLRQRHLTRAFDISYYPFTAMLEAQVNGEVDSWAIRWYASNFLRETLTLYPKISMVRHMGFDGRGTNAHWDEFPVPLAEEPVTVTPTVLREDVAAKRELKRLMRRRWIDAKIRGFAGGRRS